MERVYTIDCVTGKPITTDSTAYCIIDFIRGCFVYGYTTEPVISTTIYKNNNWQDDYMLRDIFKEHLI